MKNLAFIFIFLFSISACKDAGYNNKNYLNGVVKITDTITTQWIAKPLANATVYLKREPDIANGTYYQKTKTDNDGYYYFNLLNEDNKYFVYFEDSVNKLFYTYCSNIHEQKAGSLFQHAQPIDLLPSSLNKGVVFNIIDTNDKKPIANASIRIYGSQFLANIDDTLAASHKLLTNQYGKQFVLNLPPATYYYNVSIKLDTFKFEHKLNSFVIQPNDFIKYLTDTLP